jgi:magnesium transporter
VRKKTRLRTVENPPRPQRPSAKEPGIVAANVYAEGRRVADFRLDEAEAWSKKKNHVVWIGLLEPGKELLERVAAQLHLHPLAIEDA